MKNKSLVMPNKMFLFAIPAFVLFVVFWISPVLQLFGYSVTNYNGFSPIYNFVGFKNYMFLFSNGSLLNSLKNTLIYTVILVSASNIIALAIALALNTKIRGIGLYRTAIYIPTLFSAIVVGFIWSYVYMPGDGLISTLLTNIGLNGSDFNILGNYNSALYGIIFVDIWKNIGTTMIIYLAGLQTIDTSLLEAGMIDGCNATQLITKIKLPLLAAAININIIFSVINGLKSFDYSFVMTNGGPGKSTNTLMFTIYQIAFTEQKFGRASAFSVVSFLLIVVITAGMIKFMNKKEVLM